MLRWALLRTFFTLGAYPCDVHVPDGPVGARACWEQGADRLPHAPQLCDSLGADCVEKHFSGARPRSQWEHDP